MLGEKMLNTRARYQPGNSHGAGNAEHLVATPPEVGGGVAIGVVLVPVLHEQTVDFVT